MCNGERDATWWILVHFVNVICPNRARVKLLIVRDVYARVNTISKLPETECVCVYVRATISQRYLRDSSRHFRVVMFLAKYHPVRLRRFLSLFFFLFPRVRFPRKRVRKESRCP